MEKITFISLFVKNFEVARISYLISSPPTLTLMKYFNPFTVFMRMHVCLCVCVYEREREREIDR